MFLTAFDSPILDKLHYFRRKKIIWFFHSTCTGVSRILYENKTNLPRTGISITMTVRNAISGLSVCVNHSK